MKHNTLYCITVLLTLECQCGTVHHIQINPQYFITFNTFWKCVIILCFFYTIHIHEWLFFSRWLLRHYKIIIFKISDGRTSQNFTKWFLMEKSHTFDIWGYNFTRLCVIMCEKYQKAFQCTCEKSISNHMWTMCDHMKKIIHVRQIKSHLKNKSHALHAKNVWNIKCLKATCKFHM